MYAAGLVTSFLLLIAGLVALLLFGYVPLAFEWHLALVLLVLAAAVYAWVWITGRALNQQCDAAVARFLSGERPSLQIDASTARTFDWLIVTLLPYLVYLLLL